MIYKSQTPEYRRLYRFMQKDEANLKQRLDPNHKTSKALYDRSSKGRFGSVKSVAKKRNIPVTITLLEYEQLGRKECFYCKGILPETGGAVDRVDSSQGYTKDNLVLCCKRCNMVKGSTHSLEETQVMIQALLKYQTLAKLVIS